jgi:hypothetical protein
MAHEQSPRWTTLELVFGFQANPSFVATELYVCPWAEVTAMPGSTHLTGTGRQSRSVNDGDGTGAVLAEAFGGRNYVQIRKIKSGNIDVKFSKLRGTWRRFCGPERSSALPVPTHAQIIFLI